MSSPYIEDPVEPIVGVHWHKKKPDTGPPAGCFDDFPYDNKYSYGNSGAAGSAIPPFAGSFTMNASNGPEIHPGTGAYGHCNPYWPGTDAMDAAPSQLAYFMNADHLSLNFTDHQLTQLPPQGTYGWYVPMCVGTWITPQAGTCYNYANIADIYTFTIVSDSVVQGWSISHPRDDGQPMTIPLDPQFPGPSFTYKYHYGKWAYRKFGLGDGVPIDAANEHDPEAGGPIYLWWYGGSGDFGIGAGSTSYQFTASVQGYSIYDNFIEDGIIAGTRSEDENKFVIDHILNQPELRATLEPFSVPRIRIPRRRGLIRV